VHMSYPSGEPSASLQPMGKTIFLCHAVIYVGGNTAAKGDLQHTFLCPLCRLPYLLLPIA